MTQTEAIKMLAEWYAKNTESAAKPNRWDTTYATHRYLDMVQANVAAICANNVAAICGNTGSDDVAADAISITHATIQALHDRAKP